jgi:hypothetical protein
MAEARPILDHEDQLDLLNRSACIEPADPIVAATRVGEKLRKARELKGTPLSDASRAVNIHPNYLTAIENGQFEDLPSRAFAIGYVARYARYLGLDVQGVVDPLPGEIVSGDGVFDHHVDVAPLPDRSRRPAVIAVALLIFAVAAYSADDIVAFATRPYEQVAAQKAVDAPRPADEQTPIGAAGPPVPPPTAIAVTPPASLRADLAPAAIEQARIAAIPLPTRIAVTPPASLRAGLTPDAIEQARIAAIPLPTGIAVTPLASLRADLTPAAIRQQTRVVALLPMPLPTRIAVTPPTSLRADLVPAVIAEQIRIARIPVPARIAVTSPASLRADLTPAAIEQARIAAIPLEPRVAVTPRASLRADLTPAAIEEARVAAIPLEPAIAVTPRLSPRPDLTPAAIAQELIIAAIPLEAEVAVTPPSPLRSDLTPSAIQEPRVAALLPMPLPTQIAVTLPVTLRSDLEPAVIERAFALEAREAESPLVTRISVAPQVSPNNDLVERLQTELPPGRRLGLGNRGSRVTLRVHGPTFVAVRDARGRAFLERPLTRGDTYRVPDRANLRLTARDGGAVEIVLDGVSLGFAGSRGLQTNGLALNPQTIVDRLRRF